MDNGSVEDRAIACLRGLATGDAVGKQTETLTRSDVAKHYPDGIKGLEGSAGDVIPRYRNNTRRQWRIGETTDDTEQTIAVARALLHEGSARHEAIGRELLLCRKSVHPGVRSMWEFQQAGDPARIAQTGNGCGAAMRVSPIGIAYTTTADLIRGAYECAIPTHGGQLAICAAGAVACAVSAAIDGKATTDVLAAAIVGAQGSAIADAIHRIHTALATRKRLNPHDLATTHFPDNPETIVPLAIVLALLTESAEETALLAANIGGDADSVASIGGAIAGALRPESVNLSWYAAVSATNGDDLDGIAIRLAQLRSTAATRRR
jgi:ADP-ribosylglycohydrolase